MKVSDEVWIATALLHQEQPSRASFEASEIRNRAQALHPGEPLRAGVNPHLYLHCVANLPPNTATYRMLYRLPDKSLRLYRQSDACDPGRQSGRMTPQSKNLPEEYRSLLSWYEGVYAGQSKGSATETALEEDPILGFIGLGKEAWKTLGGGEAILEWLRSDDPDARPPWEDPKPHGERQLVHKEGATFWTRVRELRQRGLLPRRWRVSDLAPHLQEEYSLKTIRTEPANCSIEREGGEQGFHVTEGRRKPFAYRLGGGVYELIDDPDRRAA